MDTFGSRTRKLRKLKGLTQKELGMAVGVTSSMVTQWEGDKSLPKKDSADRLCSILETNWDWLRYGRSDRYRVEESLGPHSFSPLKSTTPPIFIMAKSDIQPHLSGKGAASAVQAPKGANLIRESVEASEKTFSFIETSDGMSPRIMPGDMIYIDPEQADCTPNTSDVWLFSVGSGLALAGLMETPRGLMLRFDNGGLGWEPMPILPSDCLGKVVAITPYWLLQSSLIR